ncbi:MAG TPA: hypothetical protein VI485_27620 [Vicinamibacterales bacterium]|nr:hypothetical protein [Vicinamibacterales bacterium]
MTDEERALLDEPSPKLFGWDTGIVSALCVFALVFLVLSLSAAFLPYRVVVRGALATATLASVAWYVWVQQRERKKVRRETDLVKRETDAGYVHSTIYAIKDAVAVEEFEDEGVSFFLLLDDGATLFLSGQYLYDPVEKGFPWESFEIVRVAFKGWVLRVVPLGARVTPSRTRGPFSDHELESGDLPADGTIEQRDFDAIKTGP